MLIKKRTSMSLAGVTESRRKTSRAKTAPKSKNRKASVRKAKLDIRPASHVLGAEIRGIDLREKQSAEMIAALRDTLCKYSLLLFRDQDITPEQHVAFSRRFGRLEHHVLAEYLLPGIPEIYVLSNIRKQARSSAEPVSANTGTRTCNTSPSRRWARSCMRSRFPRLAGTRCLPTKSRLTRPYPTA